MNRRGFTLIELLVSIGIISLLLAIILPSLSSARGMGHRTFCLNNMRSIGVGSLNYVQAYDFPPYFDDAITLRGANYSYSWSDFILKGRHLATEIDVENMPEPDGTGGPPGTYLPGMVSQRAKIFQCPSQNEHLWDDVGGIPVSYRADYVATGYENLLPNAGIYRTRAHYRDAALIWLGEAFTQEGGVSTREYLRETKLQIDPNELNPLRHAGGSTYLFGDGHAEWSKTYHLVDWLALTYPWEAPR